MRSLFVSFPRSPIYHNRRVRQIKCIRWRHNIFHGDHPINESIAGKTTFYSKYVTFLAILTSLQCKFCLCSYRLMYTDPLI